MEQLLSGEGRVDRGCCLEACNDALEKGQLQHRQNSHYPTRIPGTNDGTRISELSIYKDIMTYEKETNHILCKLDQLVDEEDEFC